MLTEDELSQTKNTLKEYIERLGDTVKKIDEGEIENEELEIESEKYFSIVATEETYNCTYVILGRQQYEAFLSFYDFNLIGTLRDAIDTEEGKEIFGIDSFEASDPVGAVEEIFDRVDDNDLRRLRFQLHDHISNPKTVSTIHESNGGTISGFRITRHLFPLEDDWALPDFYDAITAITATGEKGARYLANSFAIQIPESDPEEDFRFTFDPDEIYS